MNTVKSLFRCYWPDWLFSIGLIGLSFGTGSIMPFQRFYFINDNAISYPLKDDTVPAWSLLFIGLIGPAVIMAVYLFLFCRKVYFVHSHHAILGLLYSLGWALLITAILKVSVGRLRPDFIARCQPASQDNNAPCTGKTSLVWDGRRSFPSGHSSTAFAGLTFLTLFIYAHFKHFLSKSVFGMSHAKFETKIGRASIFIIVLASIPVFLALLVAVSRVDDYRHHWQDVVIGSLIGIFSALFAFNHYHYNIFAADYQFAGYPILKPEMFEPEVGNNNNSNMMATSNLRESELPLYNTNPVVLTPESNSA